MYAFHASSYYLSNNLSIHLSYIYMYHYFVLRPVQKDKEISMLSIYTPFIYWLSFLHIYLWLLILFWGWIVCIYLSIYLSFYPSIHIFIHLAIYLYDFLLCFKSWLCMLSMLHQFIYPYIYPSSIYLYIYPSIYL